MIKFSTFFSRSLMLILITAGMSVSAQSLILDSGKIEKLDRTYIVVSDSKFKMSPTVKVMLSNNKKGSLRDLRRGDFVNVHLMTIGKKRLVDTIVVLAGEPSEER